MEVVYSTSSELKCNQIDLSASDSKEANGLITYPFM